MCLSIISAVFSWIAFKCALLCHTICAPRVLKDAFKVPLWDGLQLTQILLCLSTRSYYIPPNVSSPACSLVSVLACIVCTEGDGGHCCTKEGHAVWGVISK